MSVVRDFCGHGLGQLFHDEPNIVHVGRPGEGIVLKPGMFFTVEPMINLGRPHVKVLSDGWTAVTRDRSLSAQFEHTIGVTARRRNLHDLAQGRSTSRPTSLIAYCTRAAVRILGLPAAHPASMPKTGKSDVKGGLAEASPHYLGHRERLRERFLDAGRRRHRIRAAGAGAVPRHPRRDVKPLAKALIAKFGSFAEVVSAPRQRLARSRARRGRDHRDSRSCRRRRAGSRAAR